MRARRSHDALLRGAARIADLLAEDVRAAFDGDPAATGFDEIIFAYPGVKAVFTYRLAHELYVLGVPLIPRIMTEFAHNETGIDIHPGARIGRILHRSRHRRGHRRDDGHRRPREALPGRDARRALVPEGRAGRAHPRHQAPPDLEDDVVDLRRRDDPRGRDASATAASSAATCG